MLTGELRSKIDNVWNAFWAGGIANPIEVIEQITYLLFMRGLDEAHTREENKANRLKRPMERRIFRESKDGIGAKGGVAYEDLRWSRLKNRDPATMYKLVSEHVFPFLRAMAEDGTAHADHMKGARFTIPTPALLAKVVDLIAADVPDLLRQLDGRELKVAGGVQRLQTLGAPVQSFEEDWRSHLLSTITNPSLALLLMMVGLYGLAFEFSSPGMVAPGVIGGICLVLALFALQMLPVNYAGLALILLGLGFFAAEAFVPSYGTLGLGGLIAFGFGGMVGYVMDGGVVDKALVESQQATFTGDLGFPIHGIVGGLVMPVAALLLGVASFFVRGVPRARTMAWAVFALVFIQGSAGYAITDTAYVGLFHGANALAVLVLGILTARRPARALERVDVDAADTSVLV